MRTVIYSLLFFLMFSIGATAQTNLSWATYFGGNNFENCTRIQSDSKGNIYICGASTSSNFPLLSNNTYFQGRGYAIDFSFISKFSPSGQLLWSIPYADTTGYTSTLIMDLKIDHNDNVLVCGQSNGTALPLQNSGAYFQQFGGGVQDAFVLKLDSSGTLLWASYFGGDGDDWGHGICLNNADELYLIGLTTSTVFPLLNSGGYYNTQPDANGNAYIARFSTNGTLLWSSMYQYLKPWGCAIDTAQNLIVTGQAFAGLNTQSLSGAFFQANCAGLDDAALLKFDQNDNLTWGTFFGGSASDRAYCLEADKSGNFYMVGHTQSTNIAVQSSGAYYKPTMTGSGDIFLTKFTGAGVLAWSTYFGGSGNEGINMYDNFELDACGNLYVGIDTYSSDMPFKKTCEGGYIDSTLGGVSDQFICRFSPTQSLQWGTYVGGTGFDNKTAIEVNDLGDIFMTGTWQAVSTTGLPLINPGLSAYYDGTPNGLNDIGIVKFSNTLLVPSFSYPGPVCSQSGTIGISNAQLPAQGNFSSSPGLILDPLTGVINSNASTPGTYTITYTANQSSAACNCTIAPQTVATATCQIFMQPTVTVLGNTLVCKNSVTTLTAGGASNYYWSNSALTASVLLNPSLGTQYYVVGTTNEGCTDTVFVTLAQSNNPNVVVAGNTTICPNSVATFTASGALTYLWSNAAQTATASFSPSVTTVYQLIGYFPDGCNDTVNVSVVVDLCVGLSEISSNTELIIYSNSGSGELYIKSNKSTVLLLYDITGKAMKQIELKGNGEPTTIFGLATGIYILVDQNNKRVYKVAVN